MAVLDSLDPAPVPQPSPEPGRLGREHGRGRVQGIEATGHGHEAPHRYRRWHWRHRGVVSILRPARWDVTSCGSWQV
jgi:hypothetical protein